MALKDVMKQLRRSRNMTQKQLAAQLGVSQNAISMYETGNREPDMKTLSALAGIFGVDMNYLLESQAQTPVSRPEEIPLNRRDERDIGKKMRSMLELFDSKEALMFDGEPLDEETRELLKESYRSQLELTKRLAKVKYSPKKKKDKTTDKNN